MCLSKYSNLEHLRAVAINLYSSDDVNMEELCERELAALINTYYQDQICMVAQNAGEKRKTDVDTCSGKKLKVSNILSALELVPNEVYEMIMKGLGGEDKKNLRITSKILYNKSTLMAPMFLDWCFEANFGIQPDFVLKTEKNFHVSVLERNSEVCPMSNLINNYVNRISSLKIEKEGILMDFLNTDPSKFTQLTSLDIESVYFDEDTLLKLAPQLEHLRLSYLEYKRHDQDENEDCNCHDYYYLDSDDDMPPPEFNLNSVDKNSDCFTKLKTLKISGKIDIDLRKILTKSCNTLEHLELTDVNSFILNLNHQLQTLNSLSITFASKRFEPFLKELLSKCSRSLRTLKLSVGYGKAKSGWSSFLLDQTLNITTLEIRSDKEDIEQFLSKCPLIKDLTLKGLTHDKEFHHLELKDLRRLELVDCTARCVTSVLKHASNSSLKTLCLTDSGIAKGKMPVIPELDTVWVDKRRHDTTDVGQVSKLFPRKSEISIEEMVDKSKFPRFKIVLRRVYNLTETV